jgi:hypothetical protein
MLISFFDNFLGKWINPWRKCMHIYNIINCLIFVFSVVFRDYTHCLCIAIFNNWAINFLSFIELNICIATSMIMNECFNKLLYCKHIFIVFQQIIIYNLDIIQLFFRFKTIQSRIDLFRYYLYFCITLFFIWL